MADIINLAAERFMRKPMTEEKALTLLSEFRTAVAQRFVQNRKPAEADHLLSWRRRSRMTAKDVALILGVSPIWVRAREDGQRRLSARDAQMLANLYGITVEELMKAPPAA